MDSDSEDDEIALMLLAVALIKRKKRRKKRRIWMQDINKRRNERGINHLVIEMKLSNREAYFK